MQYTTLGKTGLRISRLAFGAGPVAGVMTGEDRDLQLRLVGRAIDAGINWFDTAAGYGEGRAESNLGAALAALGAAQRVHVATKLRLMPDDLTDIVGSTRRSVENSLRRLGLSRVTLLQLHNSITSGREDEPTSITPRDVLGDGGVYEAIEQLRSEGLVEWAGLTGIGQPDMLKQVIASGLFHTIQSPYHLLNPSAGQDMPPDFSEADYGNLFVAAEAEQMGVFAIRVYAGGALAGHPPSRHTHRTKFFPLDLYRRDQRRVEALRGVLSPGLPVKKLALQFALSHTSVSAVIIGFGGENHIDEAIDYLETGPLDPPSLEMARNAWQESDADP